MDHSRRSILKIAGAAATIFSLSACSSAKKPFRTPLPGARDSAIAFPQGVASADPQPNGILLWSRVVPLREETTMPVNVQLSTSTGFDEIVLEETIDAFAEDDFTFRAFIDELRPNTVYFYRFISEDGAVSRVGRTWTAPSPDDDMPTTIAFVCCHNYRYGFFGGYRRLINDFGGKAGEPGLDFILHLGDFIYENEGRNPTAGLTDRNGNSRVISPFPSGGIKGFLGQQAAATLEDYRHLYRAYLTDPDLQEARALFPFVSVWDDHEFADDAWQTYSDGKPQPKRRLDAMKAWSEFIPALLTECGSIDGVKNEARDFSGPDMEVVDAAQVDFDDDFQITEENNRAAINAIRIYRSLRWGKNLDLILTDQRSYKSAPASLGDTLDSLTGKGDAPENPTNGIPDKIVDILAEGRAYNNGAPPKTIEVNGVDIPNPRAEAPPVTVLGNAQKNWLMSALKKSEARWKVWGSSSPLMRFGEDFSRIDPTQNKGALWLEDTWDGFPNERNELMSFIGDSQLTNVVSLSGDRHLHAAGLVAKDYATEKLSYVMADFAVTSMSMATRALSQERVYKDRGFERFSMLPGKDPSGKTTMQATLNYVVRHGGKAAKILTEKKPEAEALRERRNDNPHIHFFDGHANGYGVARFSRKSADIELYGLPTGSRKKDWGEQGPPVDYVAGFHVNSWTKGEEPKIERTRREGKPVLGDI